jgi:predicted glycosyltransferase
MATSRSGLGHIRRAATIARAVKSLDEGVRIALLTNAPVEGLAVDDIAAFDANPLTERSAMVETAVALGARTFVSDTMVPDHIEDASCASILVLREAPATRLSHFKLRAPCAWDLVIVPNPADHWKPDLGADCAKRVQAVGWIYRKPRSFESEQGTQPQLLVATGGGGTVETATALARQTEVLIDIARRLVDQPFTVVQALGPRAPLSAKLSNADRVIDPGGDLNEFFAQADAVVSTAGYNSVLELAITTTPTMLMSIARTYDDQAERAISWGRRLGASYNADDPHVSAEWLASTLSKRARRPAVDIGPSGADFAAREILALTR